MRDGEEDAGKWKWLTETDRWKDSHIWKSKQKIKSDGRRPGGWDCLYFHLFLLSQDAAAACARAVFILFRPYTSRVSFNLCLCYALLWLFLAKSILLIVTFTKHVYTRQLITVAFYNTTHILCSFLLASDMVLQFGEYSYSFVRIQWENNQM